MKNLALILSLSIALPCVANRIDRLTTDDDVLTFIKKTLNRREVFMDKPITAGAMNFHFLKIDLNNDGLTDILINGKYLYAIIDRGRKNDFVEDAISLNDCHCELVGIDSSHKLPLLIINAGCADRSPRTSTSIAPIDTVVNIFGGFIEYNAHPAHFDFASIKISTFPCFGPCPVFDMVIGKDRNATLNAKMNNDRTGTHSTEVDDRAYRELTGLLGYLKLDSLKNDYEVPWTDDASVDIEIDASGRVKRIHDYGLQGSFGLKQLYALLYKIKDSQDWQ